MKRVLVVVFALFAVVAAASPAQAIIGGTADGEGHPNVGAVIAFGPGREYLGHCTGTLVSPTVVVSAAHCFDPATWFPDVATSYCVNFNKDLLAQPCPLNGTGHYDPRFTAPQKKGNGTSQFLAQQDFDLGVLVLDRPAAEAFPGITPSPIVGLGGLDQFATGTRNRYFTDVGYGFQREFEPPVAGGLFIDFTRNMAITPLHKLTQFRLELQGNSRDNRGTGGICSGDSGGPTFLGSTIVAVHGYIHVNNAGTCNNVSGNLRLDTASARSYLGQFLTLP